MGDGVLALGRSPAGHFASEPHTNDLGRLELPWEVRHDVNSISTADTDGAHAKTTRIWRVGVGADEQATGESIVLEKDLVDDAGARLPETDVVLCTSRGEEVVDFLVDADCPRKIFLATDLGLDQMVAVHRGRVRNRRHTRRHELEDCHLCCRILASHPIRSQLQVGLAPLNVLSMRVIQVGV